MDSSESVSKSHQQEAFESAMIARKPGAQFSWLYLIHAVGTDRYKIGIAIEPRQRMMRLQVGSPFELRLLVMVEEAGDMEGVLHSLYKKHWIHGEWYRFHDQEKIIISFSRLVNPRVLISSEICPMILARNSPPASLPKAYQYGLNPI